MNTLQNLLTANAIFSIANGTILLLFPKKIAQIFDVEPGLFFIILGIALLFFAMTLIIEIKKQRAISILWITIQDALWVVGSIILLVSNPFTISIEGNIIIAIVALVVLSLGSGQLKALARIDEENKKGQKILKFGRIVKGNKSKIWEIVSDVSNYHKVAPNIDVSKVISGNKKGMIRSCAHGKDSWTETCTLWEDEKQYSFMVDTKAPDYPYPLKSLKGTWIVNEIANNESEIVMIFEFEYKKTVQNILIHPIMKHKFTKVCKELLDNWQNMTEVVS
ncbi:type II toxin-antitoxin system RatA family toxin [Aquimarina algiphila]|uniref:type II toxin-antitoxin system RatA family toxin n=1 Tax=Aquimarina algiphila TaxID=2047982 RepID=UPI002490AD54|nr:SRPBCC family protein [Aquimarina algiphila]